MNPLNYEQIDQYLMGQLHGESLQSFQRLIESDTDLARAIAERRNSLELLDDMGDVEMKKRIQNIHEKVVGKSVSIADDKTSESTIRPLYRWLAIAASILLILAAGMWWAAQKPSADQLFAQHYEAYPVSFASRAGGDDKILSDASQSYQSGAFDQAVIGFEQALTDTMNTKAKLALGIAELELNHFTKAIQHFDYLIDVQDPIYEEQALWYKALTYLKQNDVDNCLQQLNLLDQDRFSFKRKAALELLDQLK